MSSNEPKRKKEHSINRPSSQLKRKRSNSFNRIEKETVSYYSKTTTSSKSSKELNTPNASQQSPKRQTEEVNLSSSVDIAKDLVCPITLELPYDAVMAEDGRIYERSAIEQYIEIYEDENADEPLKSPVTNEVMGYHLTPATQTKELIEKLVQSKVITGKLAETWRGHNDEKRKFENLMKSADAGNVDDMYEVANALTGYTGAIKGVQQDMKLAYHWCKKAANRGHVKAMTLVGIWLTNGTGVRENPIEGMHYLTCAAERGSNVAAHQIGVRYGHGSYGFAIDKTKAIYWYKKALDSSMCHKHISEKALEEIRKDLEGIEKSLSK